MVARLAGGAHGGRTRRVWGTSVITPCARTKAALTCEAGLWDYVERADGENASWSIASTYRERKIPHSPSSVTHTTYAQGGDPTRSTNHFELNVYTPSQFLAGGSVVKREDRSS